MAKSSKHDPLEAAKVVADEAKKTSPPPAPAPVPRAVPVVKAKAAGPVNTPKSYRVKKDVRVSWRGSLTNMTAGKIIQEHCYGGAEGVAALRASGVELEEMS